MKWVQKGGNGKNNQQIYVAGSDSLKETIVLQLNPVSKLKLVTSLPTSLSLSPVPV